MKTSYSLQILLPWANSNLLITPNGEFLHTGLTRQKITAFSAEHGKRLRNVEDQIRSWYQPFAEAIVEQLGNERLLVVTGSRGIKKSSSFIPVLQNELIVKGKPAGAISMESVESRSIQSVEQKYVPAELSDGVLILDEANITREEGKQKVQQLLVDKPNLQVIPVIQYPLNNQVAREQQVAAWEQLSQEMGIALPSTYQLPLLRLNPELAEEYIKKFYPGISKEALTIMITKLPASPRLLARCSEQLEQNSDRPLTERGIQGILEDETLYTFKLGALTQEELDSVFS